VKAIVSLLAAGVMLTGAPLVAEGPIAVRSVRVGATDVAQTAAFYEAVFGLKEVMRVERPELHELIMNFGATGEAARANPSTSIIVIKSKIPISPDAASPMVINCDDVAAVTARVKANGGTVQSGPNTYPTGSTIALVRDPSGNLIELVKQVGELPAVIRR
jgi:predicted enzyme related to lactoylglutathione lyase